MVKFHLYMSEKFQYTCIISVSDEMLLNIIKFANDRVERQIFRDNN